MKIVIDERQRRNANRELTSSVCAGCDGQKIVAHRSALPVRTYY
jgi:hypothetical protein